MKKFLRKVTLTGVDERTDIDRLRSLSIRFPFVEWGVLISDKRMGTHPRYPSADWIEKLLHSKQNLHVSGHLCGQWARDFIAGGTLFIDFLDRYLIGTLFSRIQLNISHLLEKLTESEISKLGRAVNTMPYTKIIIQVGKSGIPKWANGWRSVDFLHDCSGGRGVVADFWPIADGDNCGYAGGLNPDNLERQLEFIANAAGDHQVWIDAESGVRTDDWFDLNKVERFLEIAQPWVCKRPDAVENLMKGESN